MAVASLNKRHGIGCIKPSCTSQHRPPATALPTCCMWMTPWLAYNLGSTRHSRLPHHTSLHRVHEARSQHGTDIFPLTGVAAGLCRRSTAGDDVAQPPMSLTHRSASWFPLGVLPATPLPFDLVPHLGLSLRHAGSALGGSAAKGCMLAGCTTQTGPWPNYEVSQHTTAHSVEVCLAVRYKLPQKFLH